MVKEGYLWMEIRSVLELLDGVGGLWVSLGMVLLPGDLVNGDFDLLLASGRPNNLVKNAGHDLSVHGLHLAEGQFIGQVGIELIDLPRLIHGLCDQPLVLRISKAGEVNLLPAANHRSLWLNGHDLDSEILLGVSQCEQKK